MSDEPPERACSSTKAAEKKKISLNKSVKLDSIKSQIEEIDSDKTVSDESDDEMMGSRQSETLSSQEVSKLRNVNELKLSERAM